MAIKVGSRYEFVTITATAAEWQRIAENMPSITDKIGISLASMPRGAAGTAERSIDFRLKPGRSDGFIGMVKVAATEKVSVSIRATDDVL